MYLVAWLLASGGTKYEDRKAHFNARLFTRRCEVMGWADRKHARSFVEAAADSGCADAKTLLDLELAAWGPGCLHAGVHVEPKTL